MKKALILTAFLFCSVQAKAAAPVVDVGAQITSTATTIFVTTTPTLIVSTGTNMPCISGWNPFKLSTYTVMGQYLCERTYLEIRNDSTVSIWMGPASNVSTQTFQTNSNYGIMIPTGMARVDYDNNPNWWIVSSTTAFPVTVIQKK